MASTCIFFFLLLTPLADHSGAIPAQQLAAVQADKNSDSGTPENGGQAPECSNAIRRDDDVIKVEKSVLKVLEQRQIPSRASGIIRQSSIREGSLVKIGESVMRIDSSRIELEIEKIQIELDTAAKQAETKVDLEYATKTKQVAEVELKRANESNEKVDGLVSDSEIDRLKLMIDKSLAEMEKARFAMDIGKLHSSAKDAELRIHKLDLEFHKILSPMNGMVVEIMKRPGEWVEASQPVARLVRLDILKTEVKISAELATQRDLLGRQCSFSPDLKSLKGKQYSAKVVFVQPEVNPVNATCRVWIEIDNKGLELLPGMIGTVEIKMIK